MSMSRFAAYLVLGVLAGIGLVMAVLPNAFGYRLSFAAKTGSMQPNITDNCMMVYKTFVMDLGDRTTPAVWAAEDRQKEWVLRNIHIGDIVAYQDGMFTIDHRVIDHCSGGFVTKGDANPRPDYDCVLYKNVVGKLVWKLC